MGRPSLDEINLNVASEWARRGTCIRRRVGCVLVDTHGHTLATGYNGPPSGVQHCTEYPCPGANALSGAALDLCEAVHAEANALLRCHDTRAIHTCYVTHSPCLACVKLLLNTSCQRVVFRKEYAHDELARERWTHYIIGHMVREWIHAD